MLSSDDSLLPLFRNACEQPVCETHAITLPGGRIVYIDSSQLDAIMKNTVPSNKNDAHEIFEASIVEGLKDAGGKVPSRKVIKAMVSSVFDKAAGVLGPNDKLADGLVQLACDFLTRNPKGISLVDPGVTYRAPKRLAITIMDSWVRGQNRHVITKAEDVRGVESVERADLFRQGLRDDTAGGHLCNSTAGRRLNGMTANRG